MLICTWSSALYLHVHFFWISVQYPFVPGAVHCTHQCTSFGSVYNTHWYLEQYTIPTCALLLNHHTILICTLSSALYLPVPFFWISLRYPLVPGAVHYITCALFWNNLQWPFVPGAVHYTYLWTSSDSVYNTSREKFALFEWILGGPWNWTLIWYLFENWSK